MTEAEIVEAMHSAYYKKGVHQNREEQMRAALRIAIPWAREQERDELKGLLDANKDSPDVWYRQTKRLEGICLKQNALLAKAGEALEPYGPSLKSVKLLLAEIKDALSPIAAVHKEGT